MSQVFPTFSVVVPTRDRPAKLAICLEALAEQDYPSDRFEVIVVDDASTTPFTAPETLTERLDLTVVRHQHSLGPGVARNRGANCARNEYIAFTDDDCSPAPSWLQKLAQRFAESPDYLVGGLVINALTDNFYSSATHVILDVSFQYYDPRRGRAHFFPTSNFALAARRFRELDGFNEGWPLAAAEDREFCYRWLQRGFVMMHEPEAKVYHRHPLTLGGFCRLHFRYGRGAYHYHRLRAGGGGEGGLKPDWGFYWSCIRYPFQRMSMARAALVTMLLILWQAANAAGYFWQQHESMSGGTSANG
ncbi:MAG: hypothetical protein QOG67_4084 [Verrucomicrobiota bacterium]|jgi:glycosyltransferase involved in cell wall biosynthesis